MWVGAHLHLQGTERSLVPKPSPLTHFSFAPLSARHFCSGHALWVQQEAQPKSCLAVHTTYTEGGLRGKIWRLREASLWLIDPPDYFGSEHDRYLTFVPPEPEFRSLPMEDPAAPLNRTDKTGTGWLAPDAIAMSSRLRAHLRLMQRNLHALRDAAAIAAALNRTLLLPHMLCACDRDERPRILPSCTTHGSGFSLPFRCPLDHFFGKGTIQEFLAAFNALPLSEPGSGHPRLWWIRKRSHVKYLPMPRAREHSFRARQGGPRAMINPVIVEIARSEQDAFDLREQGKKAVLVAGSSDVQARHSLAAMSSAAVLLLQRAEGVFGGWYNETSADEFESLMEDASMSRQRPPSWCCSSWDKHVGTIEYALPRPTRLLPAACAQGAVGKPGCTFELPQCDASDSHSWYELDQTTQTYKLRYPDAC